MKYRVILQSDNGEEMVVGNVKQLILQKFTDTLYPAKVKEQYILGIEDFFNVTEDTDLTSNETNDNLMEE